MMFKPLTSIVSGLIFWYSVDCRIWSTMHLVDDCFEYECRSNNASNNAENKGTDNAPNNASNDAANNAENKGTDNAANNASNDAANNAENKGTDNAANNASNDASNNATKSTKNEEKVCGVNGVLYDNMKALDCANICAAYFNYVITVKPLGFCSENPTALDFY